MSKSIESHLVENRVFKPSREFSKAARIGSLAEYRRLYETSIKHPDKFWAAQASELTWRQKWTRALDWNFAGIGSTSNTGQAGDVTHYLYPCIGPLSSVDLSRRTAFRFPDAEGFSQIWRNPVFTKLRHAQREPGVSPVCDACRAADTRDPQHFPRLERLVADFAREHSGATQEDGGGIST